MAPLPAAGFGPPVVAVLGDRFAMNERSALVVTSISKPNWILEELSAGCRKNDLEFILIGDESSPSDFFLDGCQYYSLEKQHETGFEFARRCPTKHYARKNIGYLIAIQNGASTLAETDDDNIPYPNFWLPRTRRQSAPTLAQAGWVNVYSYFSDFNIWPRGLPLQHVKDKPPIFESLDTADVDCPIQQGLVNENPDTDAIFRLVSELPQSFRGDRRIALTNGSWCPFNSQSTVWWKDAFPLMYLPAYCSMRMTDIWRGFIAQRIAWTNNWGVLFHEPNFRQERNEHVLINDFKDEVPGYLNNSDLCKALDSLSLKPGMNNLLDNLRLCYEKLVNAGFMDGKELGLVDAWASDVSQINRSVS